jgi:hypothetical protein
MLHHWASHTELCSAAHDCSVNTSTTCGLATRAGKWSWLHPDHNALVASHPSLSVGWRWRKVRITFSFKIRLGQERPKYSPYHLNAINQMNPHCNPKNVCPSTELCRRVLAVLYLKGIYSALNRYKVKLRQELWLKKSKTKIIVNCDWNKFGYNPLTPNNWQRRRAVSPLNTKIPSKNMREKPTNTPIIHTVYELCMVAPSCFGITLPSSGSVPSAFWEMLNWGAVDRILWMGVLCMVVWCVASLRRH